MGNAEVVFFFVFFFFLRRLLGVLWSCADNEFVYYRHLTDWSGAYNAYCCFGSVVKVYEMSGGTLMVLSGVSCVYLT